MIPTMRKLPKKYKNSKRDKENLNKFGKFKELSYKRTKKLQI